jgi:hypothetical protein
MATDILIAYDCSGSTGNKVNYHAISQQIAKKYPQAKIIKWDNFYEYISHEKLQEINGRLSGYGGTQPDTIADCVKKHNFHGHLVIITDGEVSDRDVQRASESMGEWGFEHVEAHLIYTGGTVNLSVTCPFTRASPHVVYTYNASLTPSQTDTVTLEALQTLNTLDSISTVAQFMAASEKLTKALTARMMGLGENVTLRAQLLETKKRITQTIAADAGASDTVSQLRNALESNNTEVAVDAARRLTDEYYGDQGTEGSSWSATMNRLIAMAEGALRGVYDLSNIGGAIQSDRIRRAQNATQATPADAPLTTDITSAMPTFACPITMDDEHDVLLLIADGAPILEGVEKDIVSDILDCPLNLMRFEPLVNALKERLDHPISLKAYKESVEAERPIRESPMTRRPTSGGLTLAPHEDHCTSTQWALANLFTGGKLVGNQDLWYAIVWMVAKQIPYLQPIYANLDAHMTYRLKNHTTFLSLSGLPEFPTTRVPLATACWYIFASAAFGMPPQRDVLRMHLPHINELEQLVSHAGYTLPPSIASHILRLRVLLNMLSMVKKEKNQLESRIRALSQAAIFVDLNKVHSHPGLVTTEWVPIDGPAAAPQEAAVRSRLPAWWAPLDVPTLTDLFHRVDPKYSAKDITLEMNWSPVTPVPHCEWSYGLDPQPRTDVKICPTTVRPYYKVGERKWQELSEEKYGPVKQQISANEHYGNCISRYGKYPTKPEFLTYMYNREVVRGTHRTLPAGIYQFTDEIYEEYAALRQSLPVEEFVRRWENSRLIATRLAMELALE